MLDGLSVWGREILRPVGERSMTVIVQRRNARDEWPTCEKLELHIHGIDRIIGTARSPSLCDNDFNSALQPLFHNRDARYPCVGRPRRDEQLHAGFRGLLHMETNERARHFTERVAKRRTGVAPSIHGNGHSRQLYAGLHPG
jgi:hypothetical protein